MSNTYRATLSGVRRTSSLTRRERQDARRRKYARRAFESATVTRALDAAMVRHSTSDGAGE